MITFESILNTASARATALGLPLVFGDTAVQNVAANDLSTDFFTLDVSGSSFTQLSFFDGRGYTLVVRCMGQSAYMRDDAFEIETLKRTDLLLSEFMKSFLCEFDVTGLRISKVQNEYDTIKSGWQATFDVS